MLDDVRPGDGAFAACLRLFRDYPMAVRRHYAEHRYGSMVLMTRGPGATRFYVLIMEWDDLFVLRHWDHRGGARAELGPGDAVPGDVRQVIAQAIPVPRDGMLLGWLVGNQVLAVLAAHGRLPEPWEDASAVPGILVMPLASSQPVQWPPLTASPLDGGALWEWQRCGQLVDLGPLVTRQPGVVYFVPGGALSDISRRAGARIVVTERLSTSEFWLPAGVYADHSMLREGLAAQTASELLALPGTVDLASGPGQRSLAATS